MRNNRPAASSEPPHLIGSHQILAENARFAAASDATPSLSHNPPGFGSRAQEAHLHRLSVLVCHPWMGFGGSEATTMWTIQALQEHGAQVTFVTASDFDPERFNRVYGTSVDASRLIFQRAPRLPGLRNGARLAHLQSGFFQRHCREIAPLFDICVSGYNLIDFGRPGIQLIGDYTFSESLRRDIDPDANRLTRHRDHFLRRFYLALGDWLRGDVGRPLPSRGDLVLANSDWTRDILESENVGLSRCPVLFPPVMYTPATPPALDGDARRAPFSFACLGRICPEKRIDSIIRILGRVREAGYPVTLAIAGSADSETYGAEISALAREAGDWVTLTGFLASVERDRLLAGTAFGIHARPAEAFGIAVAEMAGSGCIPFVPDMGGPAEIVDNAQLRFRTESEAVEKIIAVLSRPETHDSLRRDLAASMHRFRPAQFMADFINLVGQFLKHPTETPAGSHAVHHRDPAMN